MPEATGTLPGYLSRENALRIMESKQEEYKRYLKEYDEKYTNK